MSFPSPELTDHAYPSFARNAFVSVDALFRGEASPFFVSEEKPHKYALPRALDQMWRVVHDMKNQIPFKVPSDPPETSLPVSLTPADQFGKRTPVWEIIDKTANEVFNEGRDRTDNSVTENAQQIYSLPNLYSKCQKYPMIEASFLKDLHYYGIGVKSLKVFDAEDQEIPLAEKYAISTNQHLFRFVALAAKRLDTHLRAMSEKTA